MAFSTVTLIGDTVNEETNIVTKSEYLRKNPYWLEADQLAVYVQDMKELD